MLIKYAFSDVRPSLDFQSIWIGPLSSSSFQHVHDAVFSLSFPSCPWQAGSGVHYAVFVFIITVLLWCESPSQAPILFLGCVQRKKMILSVSSVAVRRDVRNNALELFPSTRLCMPVLRTTARLRNPPPPLHLLAEVAHRSASHSHISLPSPLIFLGR